MKTSNRPWYRKSRDAWYVQIGGKQVQLAKGKANRAAARQAWLSLMNGDSAEVAGLKLSACFDDYLGQLHGPSLEVRRPICEAFLQHFGPHRLACDLKHQDVYDFWKPHWSDSYRRTQVNIICAALNLAIRKRKLSANPLAGIEKPAFTRRQNILSAEDLDRLTAAAKGRFGVLLRAMTGTGCRPGEICKLQIRDCNLVMGTWTVANKVEHQTGLARRTIYLSDDLILACRQAIGDRTSGPVFLNDRNGAWNPTAILGRFRRLREKLELPVGLIPYATRHRYASDAINKHGMDSLVVAKLMGHSNPMMLAKTYFHEDAAAMRAAANRARGSRNTTPSLPYTNSGDTEHTEGSRS